MKKEEKTKQTCEKIVHAATIEFGSRSYDAVSLNAICGKYQIAKGLIYHNFKNKDELYLYCVKKSFEKLMKKGKKRQKQQGKKSVFFWRDGKCFLLKIRMTEIYFLM